MRATFQPRRRGAPLSRATSLCAVVGLAFGFAATVHARLPDDEAAQTARIRAERTAADRAYDSRVRECASEFAVTACIDAARKQRHAAHLRLDQEQRVLDDARRQQRAAARQQEIDAKTAGEEAARRDAAARARSEARAAAASEPARAAPQPASAASRPSKPAIDPAERAAQEARARRAYELKQLQAEAHRREAEERNAARARKANPGAPLPVPPASAPG